MEPAGENDPTQVPPLPQRHTYFQENPLTHHDPLKARAALRRVIKPPARFKNSRMSLRLRHRPVLCAKCKTLCEEKNGVTSSSNSGNSNKENPEDQDSSKKVAATPAACTSSSAESASSLSVTGVATRRSKSVESSCNPSSVSSTSATSVKKSDAEVEQDYSFVSIGTKSFVDNYWKRPNPGPEEPPSNGKERSKSASSTNNGSNGSKEVKVPRLSSRIEARSSGGSSETKDTSSTSTASSSSLAKENKSVKINGKKSKNIKLCITKVAAGTTMDVKTEVVTTQGGSSDEPCSSTSTTSNLVEDDAGGANTKDLRTLRKRNTTVPVRFRDQGYVTKKNIFNFKRRRDEDGEEDTEGMPDLTDRSSPLMEGDSTVDEDALHPPKLSKSSSPEALLPRVAVTEEPHQEHSTNAVPIVTETPPDGKSVSSGEPLKTPVIKISFGSPGNGVVIQIPPKAKQEEPLLSSSGPLDRAVRKAMKKAKKEARRKLSLSSREPSPDPPPQTVMMAPILPNCDHSESTALPGTQLIPLPEPSTSSNNVSELPLPVLSFKKKKKEKKKKRDKEMNGALLQSSRENSSSQADSRSNSVLLQNHDRISPSSTTENDATMIEPVIPPLTLSLASSKSITIVPSEKHSSVPVVPIAELSPQQAPPQRLCISLKRLTENSLGWDIAQNNRNHYNNSNNNELSESASDSGQSSPAHLEPNDVMETLPDDDENRSNASSLDSYTDERRNYVYKKGDIVWGKLPGCPWWPGKVN